MFKKNKLAVAVGAVLTVLSASAIAQCAAPTATVIANSGVLYSPLSGSATVVTEACQVGRGLKGWIDIYDANSGTVPIHTVDIGDIGEGYSFNIGFTLFRAVTAGQYRASLRLKDRANDYVKIMDSDGYEYFETKEVVFTVAAPDKPVLVATNPSQTPESGTKLLLFSTPESTNCLLSTAEDTARDLRLCYLEATKDGVPLLTTGGVYDASVFIPAGVAGSSYSFDWTVSKFNDAAEKIVLWSGVQNIEYEEPTPSISFFPGMMLRATRSYSQIMEETEGAYLAVSKEEAQASALAGNRSYWINFTHLPKGITATTENTSIKLSGTIMEVGNLPFDYTIVKVLADGTTKTIGSDTRLLNHVMLPASGVSIPETMSAETGADLTISPTISGGACSTVTSDPLTASGQNCLLTWTETGGLTQNGVNLEGKPSVSGAINAAWKIEFVQSADKLLLSSGNLAITVSDVQTTATLTPNLTAKALSVTSYQVVTPDCTAATDNTEATAITEAQAAGVARCFVTPSMPVDFLTDATTVSTENATGKFIFSGMYKTAGNAKGVSFVPKKVLPNGTVIPGTAVQGQTTVADHGLSYSATAPLRANATKDAQISVASKGSVSCTLTSDTTVTNTLATTPANRQCIVTFTGSPENWSSTTPDVIGGNMPDTGDVTVGWQVLMPMVIAGSVQNIAVGNGSKTISGYVANAPVFKFTGRVLGTALQAGENETIGTNSKGELGGIIVDTGTTGLKMSVKVTDANGAVLTSIASMGVKEPKTLKIASLGTGDLFASQTIKVRVAYLGDDADTFTERLVQVVRLPEVTPTMKVTAPKRVKAGDPATFNVQLGEVVHNEFVNNASRMGVWKIRLAKVNADKTLTYLSNAQSVTAADGASTITLEADDSWMGEYLTVVTTLDTTLEAAAKTFSSRPFKVLEYVWPAFDLEVRQPAAFAPSDVRLRLTTTDKRFAAQSIETGVKATYTWDLPDGVTLVKNSGSMITVRMDEAGQYQIDLTVADPTGSSTKLTKTVQVAEPAALNVDMKMYSNNKWPGRAPASFTLRPEVSGGHPLDRITNYKMTVDNQEVHNSATYPRALSFADAGDHSIELKVTSKMGATGTFTKNVPLAENQAPTCVLTKKSSRGTGSVNAVCSDVDGKIVSYSWTIDGVQKTANRNYYTFPVLTGGSSVEITATDDVGASVTVSTTVTP